MLKKLLFIFPLVLFASALNATRLEEYLIDTPTAKVAPIKTFASTSRIFSQGGFVNFFTFTPFERFSIGTSLTIEHLVGTDDDDLKVLPPSLQLKTRLFDGTEILPIIALGFNNQGFYYDHDKDEYLQKARGLYLVATQELFLQDLMISYGGNITTDGFEFEKLHGFVSLNYSITDYLDLITEWDNIRTMKKSRVNSGFRIYIADFFALDLAIRNYNAKAERILQVKYTYTF